ncbi:hypothetical protein [Acrocarpospora catenulata]|uniref:hypothetical protein n=1 Tax=Acrocarpospora catenulata TaxID=2836182 RepID=UPI001BDA7014|nr:hypothetical protein [Acrocarpospora catenulata]
MVVEAKQGSISLNRRLPRIGLILTLALQLNAVATTSAQAAPCGLSGRFTAHGSPLYLYYNYTIRQCNGYPVRRQVDVVGEDDGRCHVILGHSSVTGRIAVPIWGYVRGLKAC